MFKTKKNGFTLVELLAVIVILAVILVIAVPSIMDTIKESRKGALASSAKLIASTAETAYISNQTLGIEKDITCSDVSNYTEEDYTCSLEFVGDKAYVTLEGYGKFEGLYVCSGTKENAEATEEACTGGLGGSAAEPISFETDSWATIKAAVTAGDTENYHVGDTKTVDLVIDNEKKTYTLRIANNSHYKDVGECKNDEGIELASETACGFVIEFADIKLVHNMNDDSTNQGGWPASGMRTYVNGDIYNALVSAIGNVIIDTKVVSGHGSSDTTGTLANNNFESIDKLYLLSPEEVYGTSFTDSLDTSIGTSRQLDWYSDNGVTTSNYSDAIKQFAGSAYFWWLRSARSDSTSYFYRVTSDGNYGNRSAYYAGGVSPAFRLG